MQIPFKRNIYNYLVDLMNNYPAVAIIGARQVGKTTLAKQAGSDFLYVDLENSQNFDRLANDPGFFFKQHPSRVIFDEAQELPELFPTLRSVIDEDRPLTGRFLLTGSSSPELLHNISESLAGRIAIIQLGTLKANEYYDKPLSDFYQLFQTSLDKNHLPTQGKKPPINRNEMQSFWFTGGYPELLSKRDPVFSHEWMTDYQSTYVNRDIARLFPKLNKVAYRRFITMLGKLSGKLINKSDISRSIGVSQPVIREYLDIASGTFIWRQLYSYESNINRSITKMPRGHIRDSGLLHHLLHINDLENLQSDPIAGFSFEAFVCEEIIKGLQDARLRNYDAYFYRTRNGAEIDLILEGPFGLLPIEIKYGYHVSRNQLRALTDFIEKHKLSFGILINQADQVEWLTEQIIQIPAGFL